MHQANVDEFSGFQVQLPGVFAGYLVPKFPSVFQDQSDPDLETEPPAAVPT